MNSTLRIMIDIAAEATAEVMRIYLQPFSVDFKGPNDPITLADRRANQLICERLSAAFPDIPIVAEESPPAHWAHYRDSDRVFFVDPVDGTREFVAKSGQFATMIGLLEGDRPTHGVLHAPALNKVWAGVVGEGVFRIVGDEAPTKLPPLKSCALQKARVVSSRSQKTKKNRAALDLIQAGQIIPMGSAGLKAMALIDAQADIYLATEFAGCLWDSCAPEALILALGGRFTDARGQLIDYRAARVENNRGAVAAAPELHNDVIDQLSVLFR